MWMRDFGGSVLIVCAPLIALCPSAHAGQAARSAQTKPPSTGEINLTATSANVSQSGAPVTIRILRWSTDEERNPVVAALTPTTPAAATSAAAAPQDPPAQAGRAAAGRGGRGGGRRGRGEAAVALTPTAALTAAIGRAPTVGYIWTGEVTGYSIKYAYHGTLADGRDRIILATNRRLGANTTAWEATVPPAATDYEFTLVEMRFDAKGSGEGKTSLTTKVVLDNEAKTVALDDYAGTPAMLRNVKR
jgi:hypothetical protein